MTTAVRSWLVVTLVSAVLVASCSDPDAALKRELKERRESAAKAKADEVEAARAKAAQHRADYERDRGKIATDVSKLMAAKEWSRAVNVIEPWKDVADDQLIVSYKKAYAELEVISAAEHAKRVQEAEAIEQAKRDECRKSAACFAKGIDVEMAGPCQRAVERLAKHDFQWTDGWTEPKFSAVKWIDQKAGVVGLLGDKIKMQNGFGAWTHMVYVCEVDVQRKAVVTAGAQER